MPPAVVLSVCIGVASCGWPNSANVVQRMVPSFPFTNRAPTSDCAMEDTTTLRIPVGFRMAPFGKLALGTLLLK